MNNYKGIWVINKRFNNNIYAPQNILQSNPNQQLVQPQSTLNYQNVVNGQPTTHIPLQTVPLHSNIDQQTSHQPHPPVESPST